MGVEPTIGTVHLDLTPEQEDFRKVVRDFAEREIAPHAEAWDRDHSFPVDTVRAGRALGAFGLTEPDGGSDAGATTTRARLEDDAWVIDGSKAFITNSGTPITSIITVTASTGPGEISAIIVPAGTPGLVVEPP